MVDGVRQAPSFNFQVGHRVVLPNPNRRVVCGDLVDAYIHAEVVDVATETVSVKTEKGEVLTVRRDKPIPIED